MKVGAARPGIKVRRLAYLAGNLFLGFALGLLSYYGLTALVLKVNQAALDDRLAALGPIAETRPPVTEEASVGPGPWEGWEAEDLDYWNRLEEGGVFGRLVIPAMDLDVVVVKGTSREDLKKGPGWIVQTDPPGPSGNCGISGHRTTYGAPFRRLDVLEPGDEIEFYSPFRRYLYEVTEHLVVRPYQTEVVRSTPEPMLTLTACHPPYSAAYRLVVHADLKTVSLLEGAVAPEKGSEE